MNFLAYVYATEIFDERYDINVMINFILLISVTFSTAVLILEFKYDYFFGNGLICYISHIDDSVVGS